MGLHVGRVPAPHELPLPFPTSLCHRCVHKRDVKSARAWFLRCVELESKYAPQPVRACPLFEPLPAAENPQ